MKPGSQEKKIYDALDKTVDVLDFSEPTPLRDVLTFISEKFGIPIKPDLKGLDDATIDLNESLVTAKIVGGSLGPR